MKKQNKGKGVLILLLIFALFLMIGGGVAAIMIGREDIKNARQASIREPVPTLAPAPTIVPTKNPVKSPSCKPTKNPTENPTKKPEKKQERKPSKLPKKHPEITTGHEVSKNEAAHQLYQDMIKEHSYPQMKGIYEDEGQIHIKAIKHGQITVFNEGVGEQEKVQLYFSICDLNKDGIDECLVTGPATFEYGKLVFIYGYKEDEVKLLDYFVFGSEEIGNEEYECPMAPFQDMRPGESMLYYNKAKNQLYVCNYGWTGDRQQDNFIYTLKKSGLALVAKYSFSDEEETGTEYGCIVQERGKEAKSVSKAKAHAFCEKFFADKGENVPFYSYEEVMKRL